MKCCLFCDRTELTREHLWPSWLVDHYAGRASGPGGTFSAEFKSWDGTNRQWTQRDITQRKRLLCQECNNETLGSVEHVVKPYLLPLIEGAAALRIPDFIQLYLSAWITVRSMIWDGIAPEATACTSQWLL